MKELFMSANYDSTKNKYYIESDAFDQIKICEFTKLLKNSYKSYFANKKTERPNTHEIFVKITNNYKINLNRQDAIKDAINMISENHILIVLGKGRENYELVKKWTTRGKSKEKST